MSPLLRKPSLRRRKESNSCVTVLDIGTATVKALIVKKEGDQGIVIGVGKTDQKPNDMQAGSVANIQSVIDTCEKSLTLAEDMSEVIPRQVVIGVAGEQVFAKRTSVAFPRQQPTARISQTELSSAIQLVQRRAMRETIKDMSQSLGVDEVNAKLIHSVITGVEIDGHTVTNPLDFQGHKITISIFNTFAPIAHVGALQTIADELDLDLIATVAEPYALARGCMSSSVMELGGVFVDVGGGTTDVVLVENGGIESMKMCALGGRSFTRRLMNERSLSFEEAESFKKAYSSAQLPLEQRRMTHELLKPTAEVLAQGIGLIMEELAGGSMPPTHIYLAGGGSLLPDVEAQIKLVNWKDFSHHDYHPVVSVLGPDNVSGMYDATGALSGQQDVTPLALARHALSYDSDDDEPLGDVMRRVLKTMKV